MAFDYQSIIDRYYPAGTTLRDIYLRHCQSVAELALEIARKAHLPLNPADIEAASMLHDIGIFLTDAPGIRCFGSEPYIRHGILGARLLRDLEAPEAYARVAERHTGAGLTASEIVSNNLPLPPTDYCPETLLERLICYADKFYSKSGSMERKTIDSIRRSMARFGQDTLDRFDALHDQFS